MKTIIVTLTLIMFSLAMQDMQAQNDSIPIKTERLETLKQKIIEEEKEGLKSELERIQMRLDNKFITQEEADKLKKEVAEKRALNIENRIAILENKTALEERNNNNYSSIELLGNGKIVNINVNHDDEKDRVFDKRTTSDLVLAAGFNNVISDENSLDNSDFKIGGSRFFEIGWAWKTRVFENSNWLRVKYGVSFQFNGLKPTDNKFFVKDGDLTQLEEFEYDLDKSKFRSDNLVFPLHFEFGPSKKTEGADYFRYNTSNQFKIGVGGYAGFNIGERQKLKYTVDGDKKKDKLKSDYNTNDFVYGLSSYVSLGGTALYVKYDLNPLFKDPNIEMRNISFGLRFDID
ncbi:hypothetical protein BC962_1128 [Gillisia mitskevichiae]|uniref:Outer membrane protein with beta-barrel domain n=1 Tax=Gillisia mitskevichiae TaxID=270921 RepID=A0A495Q0C7_9FLAO|nr:hypothetical protein [Gillisia mitskevichiae]RKS56149.1 hypothetical protein BC962_1128 [Gillisia mitskevichiae]